MMYSTSTIVMAGSALAMLSVGAWLHYSNVQKRLGVHNDLVQALENAPDPEQIDAIEEGVRHLRDDASVYPRAVPGDGDVTELVEAVTRDLNQLNMHSRSLTMGDIGEIGPFQQIRLDLSCRGDVHAVHALLGRLSDYDRIVRTQRLVVTREPNTPADSLAVSAVLLTYCTTAEESSWR